MTTDIKETLIGWAHEYNDPKYFQEDPIAFPREFAGRMLDEMDWKPYEYVMNGEYRDENASLHRTIKWSEFAAICGRLRTRRST